METPLADVRKISVLIDEVLTEAGRKDGDPVRRVAVMAAVRNPLVGSFTEDLQPMMDVGGEVALEDRAPHPQPRQRRDEETQGHQRARRGPRPGRRCTRRCRGR